MDDLAVYFVYTGKSSVETDVIRELRPPRLRLSFDYFKTKNLEAVVHRLGYRPEIMLESGALTLAKRNGSVSLLDYLSFIRKNRTYIDRVLSLDVLYDPDLTYAYYQVMKAEGLAPMPVYHYQDDISWLEKYIAAGETYIALGGTSLVNYKKELGEWVNYLWMCFPDVSFHMMGGGNERVRALGIGLRSIDTSSWVMMAVNGYPKCIPGTDAAAKKLRAKENMRLLMGG